MERAKADFKEQTKQIEIQFQEKEALLRSQLKDELDELVRQHQEATDNLKLDFSQLQAMFDKKYTQLEARYQEISQLYDDRPSRSEDLDLLRRLKKACEMKDEQLLKAQEDMKKYKLLLENREESYNKMFGTKPQAGVLNPNKATGQENMALGGTGAGPMGGMGAMTVGPMMGSQAQSSKKWK